MPAQTGSLLSVLVVGTDEHGHLTGSASGQSAREILRMLAQSVTEDQARQILARIGTVTNA